MAEESSPTPNDAKPQELSYARDGHLIRKRNRQRRIFYITGLLALIISGFWWAPAAYRQAVYQIALYQCNKYEFPPGVVRYDISDSSTWNNPNPVPCQTRLEKIHGPSSGTTVYLHHRNDATSGGLVVVTAKLFPELTFGPLTWEIKATLLPTDTSPPTRQSDEIYLYGIYQIHAGITDQADDSHFTIIYTDYRKITDTIDGYVRDGKVVLEKRRPPATQTVSPSGSH